MAENPAGALQRALVAHLGGDAGVVALVADRVFDEPPSDVQLPYIRLCNFVCLPLRMDGYRDWTVTFGIEVLSDPVTSGRVEATAICAAIVAAPDDREAAIPVEGFTFDWCEMITQVVSRSADGKTHVGTVAFEAALAPTA